MDFEELTKDSGVFEEILILAASFLMIGALLAWRIICLPVNLIRSGKTRSQPRQT